MSDMDSRHHRIVRSKANEKGWVELELVAGESVQGELPSQSINSLLSLIHISDLHICDAQSPARVEMIDRFADPHHPMSEYVKYVGTYRAQEIMTAQTLESMIRTVNALKTGIVTNRPIDAVVITGDVTDNSQHNELMWYLSIMDGGVVQPDSSRVNARGTPTF
jgi:3',5'-cyclic AMP phosphodiesterase CpdA